MRRVVLDPTSHNNAPDRADAGACPPHPVTVAPRTPRSDVRFLTTVLPTSGGSTRSGLELARHVAAAGHDVHVVSWRLPDLAHLDPATGPPASTPDNLTWHFLPEPGLRMPVHDELTTPRFAALLASVMDDLDVDVANIHYLVPALLAVPQRHLHRCIASGRGSDVNDLPADLWQQVAERLAAVRAVTAASPHLAELMASRFDTKSVHVIPSPAPDPPADLEAARSAVRSTLEVTADVVLVHVSTMLPRKQPAHCLDALAAARAAGHDAALVLIGDGPELATTLQLAHELGLKDHVVATGYRDDAHGLLVGADVVLVPSLSEGTPRAAIEALAAGVPVVGYDIPGLSELVGPAGALADPYDRTALAVATVEVLTSRPPAELARSRVVHLDRGQVMRTWTDLLDLG